MPDALSDEALTQPTLSLLIFEADFNRHRPFSYGVWHVKLLLWFPSRVARAGCILRRCGADSHGIPARCSAHSHLRRLCGRAAPLALPAARDARTAGLQPFNPRVWFSPHVPRGGGGHRLARGEGGQTRARWVVSKWSPRFYFCYKFIHNVNTARAGAVGSARECRIRARPSIRRWLLRNVTCMSMSDTSTHSHERAPSQQSQNHCENVVLRTIWI